MKNLRAVIFDMDGLMLDSERLAMQSLQRAGASVGLHFTESMLEGCIGLNETSANCFLSRALGRPIPEAALSSAFYADYEATLERDDSCMSSKLLAAVLVLVRE